MEMQSNNHVWVCMVLFLMSFVSLSMGQDQGCTYRITTQTTDAINAGSTARIRLTLCRAQHDCYINVVDLAQYGDQGPNAWYFGRGSRANFTIKTRAECNYPCQIMVSHNNGGARPRWLVDWIDVQARNSRGALVSSVRFGLYQWVNRGATVIVNRCPIGLENVQARAQAQDYATSLLRQYADSA